MTELSDEQKKAILDEIIELTSPPQRPPDSITVQEYVDEMAARGTLMTTKYAGALLRKGVVAGELEMVKVRGVGYWRKRSSPS